MFLRSVRIIVNGKDVEGSDLGTVESYFDIFLEQTGPVGGPKVLKKGSCRFMSCIHVNVMNMKWVWLFLSFLIYIHTYIQNCLSGEVVYYPQI